MKTIVNRTAKPLRVPLQRGRLLHLGPRMTGRIADDAAELPSVLKMVARGEIEILGGSGGGVAGSSEPAAPHESTHGHHPETGVKHRGNR